MDGQVEKLLNLCLEVEGLLTLIERREDNAPVAAWTLLKDKTAKLAEGVAALNINNVTGPTVEQEEIADSALLEESGDADVAPSVSDESDAVSADNGTDADVDAPDAIESDTVRIADVPSGFTLNDKFRFRRELFANSDAEMADALDIVNAMNSVAEIEDYFYNDLCWDPENEDVKDFMHIVTARFI